MAKFITSSLAIATVVFVLGQPARAQSDKAQDLPKQIFTVCGGKLNLEIAGTPEERATGLMHRTGVKAGTGMVFVFPYEQMLEFWMRHVAFDIDIGYFDSKGELLKSYTMKATSDLMQDEALPRYSSEKPALYAVEAESGFFAGAKLKNCRLKPVPKKSKL